MSKTIIKYLTGEVDIDGYHFGETVPGRPPFWWRFHLREYEAARDKEIEDLKDKVSKLQAELSDAVELLVRVDRFVSFPDIEEFLNK